MNSQYRTGSVSVTNGSANVVGEGTSWLANTAAGQLFSIQGSWLGYEIAEIISHTRLDELESWHTYQGWQQ